LHFKEYFLKNFFMFTKRFFIFLFLFLSSDLRRDPAQRDEPWS
jgi:hypothetical protein